MEVIKKGHKGKKDIEEVDFFRPDKRQHIIFQNIPSTSSSDEKQMDGALLIFFKRNYITRWPLEIEVSNRDCIGNRDY